MKKLVKLSIENNLNLGYSVELVEIKEDTPKGETLIEGIAGYLPSIDSLYEAYEKWQKQYSQLEYLLFRGLQLDVEDELEGSISTKSYHQITADLKLMMNEWLSHPEFQKIDKKIRCHLEISDLVRIMIKTPDMRLWQLPWCIWDLFEDYRQAEIIFCASEAKGEEKPIKMTRPKQVRILAVCGEKTGIDYQLDQDNLRRLEGAGAKPLIIEEPSLQKLRNLLWDKTWDLFFFAGHSNSQQGLIINNSQSLTTQEFKTTLRTAVDNGLKIAFLNSCDGLQLAYEFVTELQIPVVIVMKEPIPNEVAQKFSEYFLLEYAERKKPLYIAVRNARQRIAEEWQHEISNMDWLPVIAQNPTRKIPDWDELNRPISLPQLAFTSLISTMVVMALRTLGLFQPLEMQFLDQMARLRPIEPLDDRIVIVKITSRDIEKYSEPIADQVVVQLIQQLEQYKPAVIGLDVARDQPQPPGDFLGHEQLQTVLKNSKNIIGVCLSIYQKSENTGISPPAGLLSSNRLGFADFLIDLPENDDGNVRRQIIKQLILDKTDPCQTETSFSLLLVEAYLSQHTKFKWEKIENDELRIGDVVLKRLEQYRGGYQRLAKDGYQILLNYRSVEDQKGQLSQEFTLTEVLENKVHPNSFKNRIVLIGYTSENVSDVDLHGTLYREKMPGVRIHAHNISQIISAVLDQRPLWWTWSWWGDFWVIICCSLVTSLLIWQVKRLWLIGVIGVIMIIPLYAGCFMILWQLGGWMPFVPSLLAILLTISGGIIIYIYDPLIEKPRFGNMKLLANNRFIKNKI